MYIHSFIHPFIMFYYTLRQAMVNFVALGYTYDDILFSSSPGAKSMILQ
jgi:hypothetical protein